MITKKDVKDETGRYPKEYRLLKRPFPAVVVIYGLQQKSTKEIDTPPNQGKFGACLGILKKVAGGEDIHRYRLLFALFPGKWTSPSEVSSSDLSTAERWALIEWVKPTKDEQSGEWIGDEALEEEITAIFTRNLDGPRHEAMEVSEDQLAYYANNRSEVLRVGDENIGLYLMCCGHQNDGYNAVGRPTCSVCGIDAKDKDYSTHTLFPLSDGVSWKWKAL